MSLRAKLLAPLVLAAALPALSLALSLIHPGGGLPRSFQMGLAFLGLLLLPGAWVYYGRTLLSPLRALEEAAEGLSQGGGDLNRRIPGAGGDELGRTAGAFNGFLESLRRALNVSTGAFRDGAFHSSHVNRELGAFVESLRGMDATLREGQEGVERITGAMEEQAAGIEELSATGQTLAQMAEDLNRTAGTIAQEAEEGRASLSGVEESLASLRERMEELGSLSKGLSERAGGIHQVVRMITEIADQTNLLALNAAIEAARVGRRDGVSRWWRTRSVPWRRRAGRPRPPSARACGTWSRGWRIRPGRSWPWEGRWIASRSGVPSPPAPSGPSWNR